MNSKLIILSLLLVVFATHTAYALSPGMNVMCCWQHEKNKELPEECSNVDLKNCDKILKSWEKTERDWLKSTPPFYLWPEFIIGSIIVFVIAISIIIWKFMKKKLHRLTACMRFRKNDSF